jgi:hypothetical protein
MTLTIGASWMLKAGVIAPHAPLLIPEVSGTAGSTDDTRKALASIEVSSDDLVVVLSPHGEETGVYASARGSLASLGLPDVRAEGTFDRAGAGELAESWGTPLLQQMPDHGVLVPLHLLRLRAPVVGCAIAESLDHETRIAEGKRFAASLSEFADGRGVTFLASMNTSCSLSTRAPLTERAEGKELDRRLIERLESGAGPEIETDLWNAAGSCAAAPFAAWTELFKRAGIVGYEHPFGVGYLVARSRD